MPSIFRTIRKQMLDQDRFFRYFKYALGEIVLVVLGILIALEVNNYNESRKARVKERAYLEKIAINIDGSTEELQRVVTKTEHKQQRIDSLRTILKNAEWDKYSTLEIMDLIYPLQSYSIYTSDHSASVELLSTGDLQLIRNTYIRNLVSSRQSDLHEIEKWEQENLYYVRQYGDYLNENIDTYRLLIGDTITWPVKGLSKSEFLTSKEYFNVFTSVGVANQGLHQLYKKEKQKLDSAALVVTQLLEAYNEVK